MKSTQPPYPLLDDGVQHGDGVDSGTFLTVDFCPSRKDVLETRFFDALDSLAARKGAPVPIALSMSGRWLRSHPRLFESLIGKINLHRLTVTWVNHSDSHPFLKGKGPAKNFLLESGIDSNREIIGVEIDLLERGQLPSVFFRFPGLVSSRDWIERIVRYSLIPLGADAWLAVKQVPRVGSVILVHGNGNEPKGIELFLKQLPQIQKLGPFLALSSLFPSNDSYGGRSMNVRKAGIQDREDSSRWIEWIESSGIFRPYGLPANSVHAALLAAFEDPQSAVYVAEENGETCGFAWMKKKAGVRPQRLPSIDRSGSGGCSPRCRTGADGGDRIRLYFAIRYRPPHHDDESRGAEILREARLREGRRASELRRSGAWMRQFITNLAAPNSDTTEINHSLSAATSDSDL